MLRGDLGGGLGLERREGNHDTTAIQRASWRFEVYTLKVLLLFKIKIQISGAV
jgi:hypothetical protein